MQPAGLQKDVCTAKSADDELTRMALYSRGGATGHIGEGNCHGIRNLLGQLAKGAAQHNGQAGAQRG
jgi:hypothetical protein